MTTGRKFGAWGTAVFLCLVSLSSVTGADAHGQRKAKKPALPPLPSGPQGPVPQVPLDSIPAVAPQVIYQSGQLTILAPNSSLADILRAVRKQTAAEIEIPANANERVVTNLGPGPAREVVAELLNGSRFNYVLLGSPSDASRLTRVVLVAKTGADVVSGNSQPQPPGVGISPVGNLAPPPQEAVGPEAQEAEAVDESAEENSDQNAEAEQQAAPPEQPGGIKTPQQMLQEMQQRQLQMQQQVAPGQPPIPGAAIPPQRPPQPEP
jgi:hypothetical protein